MKILFLQKVDDARGGVINVNLCMMQMLSTQDNEISVLSIRHGYTMDEIIYPETIKQYLANDKDIWGCPRLFEIARFLKQGHLVKAVKLASERIRYKKQIAKDYEETRRLIDKIGPDVIIVSHYEILEGVPEEYLGHTIMHFHTSFDQVMANKSYIDTFNKYKDKIHSFVWLSKATAKRAIEYGYKNSLFIYNPIPFSSDQVADHDNKKVIFLGRLSDEKRVHLAIRYFKEVIEKNHIDDWMFEIYGNGDLEKDIKEEIGEHPCVKYMGRTDNVKETLLTGSVMVLTSSFEGMPLSVLEANECGVPVIAYDFGESANEVIDDKVTGVIVPQDDEEEYKRQLEKIILDNGYRWQLSANAKEFVKAFSITSVNDEWGKLLMEISKK